MDQHSLYQYFYCIAFENTWKSLDSLGSIPFGVERGQKKTVGGWGETEGRKCSRQINFWSNLVVREKTKMEWQVERGVGQGKNWACLCSRGKETSREEGGGVRDRGDSRVRPQRREGDWSQSMRGRTERTGYLFPGIRRRMWRWQLWRVRLEVWGMWENAHQTLFSGKSLRLGTVGVTSVDYSDLWMVKVWNSHHGK